MTETEVSTLQCEAGHDWTRPKQRGRPPRFCPEHAPVVEPKEPRVLVSQLAPADRNAKAIARIDTALELDLPYNLRMIFDAIKRALSRPRNEERDGPYKDLTDTLEIHISQNRLDV